ncbi:glycoside hydrolase family 43 protein [Phytohabitans houttuyneae]|uniref:glycoside hydrolase family 43 protein n=1 Tax=Phytohabitans houttuyneae TaxID=1076126 RepID=UPI0031ECA5FE
MIPGMHPDPSICRVGGHYYLACSSFEYFPGVPVFRSQDLVHWEQIGNALDRTTQLDLPPSTPSSGGVYAPTLRYHDGRFHLITSVVPHAGTMVVTSTDPAGPWSDPVWLPDVGIDPDLAWAADGTAWCTFAGIRQVRVDLTTGAALGTPRRIWSGTPGAQWPEAPHLYEVDGTWYLMIAEGGTDAGHGISVARGPAPDGPFEPCPDNPILSHRSTDHPVQNTGHGDLVQAADGSWWLVFLGTRPRGGPPGWHVLGRETFLAPVTWVDGWPVVGEVRTTMTGGLPPQPVPVPPARDDFDGADLRPCWISVRARPAHAWSLKDRPGWLTLHAQDGSLDDPSVSFIGRRQQHHACRVRALVDAAEGRGGLAVRLDEQHHYEVEAGGGEIGVRARVGALEHWRAARPVPDGPVVLRVETQPSGPSPDHPRQEPDVVRLGYETPTGRFVVLDELDGRYLSTQVAGGFTGRVIGMYATAGTVRFDWLAYEPDGDDL